MRLRILAGLGVALAATAFVLSLAATVLACAVAPPKNVPVEIASESAIILWDAKDKTEHFIRRASFKTEAKDFGFLVPTPTRPELKEANDDAFKELARLTAPKTITQRRPSSMGCGCGAGASKKTDKMPGGVEVLEVVPHIAGYEAAVLKANDAAALTKWLQDNGYESSPPLKAWLQPYLDQGWIITAFKIAKKEANDKAVASSAVRMTFHTERPFFPYREPPNQFPELERQQPQRLLRIFFLANERVQGTLGKDKAWPGKVAWSGTVAAANREKILELLKLPEATPPASWWLTEFEDYSSPRPGTDDVFFSRSATQMPVERPPHIQYVAASFPDDVMGYALVACVVLPPLVRRWRKRRLA